MREAVITDCVRTAVGKMNGSLGEYDEQVLAAAVIKEVIGRSRISADDVDEVIFGHVKMNTYPMDVARYSWLEAGLNEAVPGYTLHRACSSGSQAIFDASQIIGCGDADVILAGGVENMTKSCYYLRNARHGVGTRDMVFKDNIMEGSAGNSPEELFGDLPMGLTAENVAEQYHIEREAQDLFAYNSQLRAKKAISEGKFKEQILPVGGFDTDEFPRETSLEKLAKLRSAFKPGGCVTAGNSSGRNDGASAVIVMSREKADALGYDYYLRHVASAVVGIHPSIMGVGPIGASKEALQKAGLGISDIGLIELNEAFASQSVAVMREWVSWSEKETYESIWERTNVNGSGISLGHPLAATGCILTTKLFYELKNRPDVRYAMVTMCIGGGMGFASVFEQCRR
nr:thiolase family protein [Lachnospiraceae bacterium]